MPNETLQRLASPLGSLYYEALMLKESAARCKEPPGTRSLASDVPFSMAIECFLTHFRNLRDFLYPKKAIQDDVIAFDFNDGWNKTIADWNPCSEDEGQRINKLLAHLSYSRPSLNHEWRIGEMRHRITESMAEFIGSLPPDRKEWFRAWGL